MSQVSTYAVAPGSWLAVRSQISDIFDAVKTTNSGNAAPESPVAGMIWFDTSTTPGTPRVRNVANTAWEVVPTGATATGTALIRAADAAAARTAIGADGEFSLAATGWQRLPSGLIIQWGTQSVSANSTLTGSFPIAFPSACFAFLSSHGIGGNWQNYDSFNVMGGAGAISLTQYQISSFDDLTAPYSWIALGN